jgi:hypothetical protein
MKNQIKIAAFLMVFILSAGFVSRAQKTESAPKKLIKSTTFKTETVDFGAGGTVTVVGAPNGSITVEGWQKNEIEVQAEIELQAESEADLKLLAAVNNFVLDEGFGHTRILTVGTHDRSYMKKTAKKFPKHLLEMPFKIDYKIKVPYYTDLEINGGKGDFALTNVEGAMFIKFLESNARLNLSGGAVDATFGGGSVEIAFAKPSWRGRMMNVALAAGTMNVIFPPNMNADLDASILRTGKIENEFAAMKPRDRTKFSEKSIVARAGNGGAALNFKVGDGTLKIGGK